MRPIHRVVPAPILAILSLAVFALAGACQNTSPPGTYFDTQPPGAEVLLDGRRSGYVTPCLIALDRDDTHRVSFALPGFVGRDLVLEPGGRTYWIPWGDGSFAPNGATFPLALTASELFAPRRTDDSLSPGRVFIRLRPRRE